MLRFPASARIAAEALQRIAQGEGTSFDVTEVMRLVKPSWVPLIVSEPEPERLVGRSRYRGRC